MKRILQGILALTLLASTAAYSDGCCGSSCNGCNTCCNSCNNGCGCNNNCGCNSCCLGPCDAYPYIGYRSQSRNEARRISGIQEFIHQYGKENVNGDFSLALEYTRSFKPEKLAKQLFGCDLDCCNTLYVQGSDVTNRNAKAWLADYFGLSPLFSSAVRFCPRIENVLVDMNLHLGLDGWHKGLFLDVYSPLTWTKWQLNMQECIKDSGSTGFAAGYMDDAAIARGSLANSFTEAMSGTTVFGDMKEAIKFQRMTNCPLTKVGLADLRATFGWNFVLKEDYHFGLFLHAAFPTGNRPTSCYLFEPIVGNGHHWELGGGFTSKWIFWRSKDYDDRNIGFWFDGTFTHMFKDCQCRSFDFCNKPNSRYMLLEQMGTNSDDINALVDSTKTVADYQYTGNLIPAINWSTFKVDVSVGMQADVVFKFGYNRENWNFDLGYNLWARTAEKFCQDCCCNNGCGSCGCNSCCNNSCNTCCTSCCTTCTTGNQYAIKGTEFVYGYPASSTTPAYKLSATESSADIHYTSALTPTQTALGTTAVCQNPKADNPYAARTGTTALDCYNSTTPVYTSIQPVLATKCLLNMCSAPSAITHKVFAHINHAWKDRKDNWVPFIGMGFEVEAAQGNSCCNDCCGSCCNTGCCNSCCTTPSTTACNSACNSGCGCGSCGCNSCGDNCCCTTRKTGVFQYGLWFKGGVSFD